MQDRRTEDRLAEYRGAIHIHTRFSDGSGGMEDVVAAARRAGLDFIVVTDHDTLAAKDEGWEGWHDGVLVIAGVEISPIGPGHCLAWDVRDCKGYRDRPASEYLAAIKAQGGLAIPAHPQGKTIPLSSRRMEAWTEWGVDSFAGIEVWSYMQNWMDGLSVWNLWRAIRRPEERIAGPGRQMLRQWDALGRHRRVVGLAGLDAHARRLPFTWIRIFSYEYLFRTLRTHILSPPFTHQIEEDKAALRRAIELGRCFMANDLLADSTGFVFRGRKANGSLIPMGSETSWEPGVRIEIASPRRATLDLVRNSGTLSSDEASALDDPAPGPGVYRAEASLNGMPWIFSNPIYLR